MALIIIIKAGIFIFLFKAVHHISALSEENSYSCEHGWHQNGNYCYHLEDDATDWDSAACHCLIKGAYLTSIESREQQDFINDVVLKGINGNIWIGLQDITIEGQYTWEDGSKFDYRNWNLFEPSGTKNSQEDCVELLHDGSGYQIGRWNDVRCDFTKRFICKKHAHNVSALSEESLHACGDGWLKEGSYCYHLEEQARKWNSAACYCIGKGGHLTSIHSKEEQDFLNDFFLKRVNKNIWIGLHDITIEGRYTWEDGSKFDYKNWNDGEPSGFKISQEDCVVLLHDGPGFGRWNDAPCIDSKPFICKKHAATARIGITNVDNKTAATTIIASTNVDDKTAGNTILASTNVDDETVSTTIISSTDVDKKTVAATIITSADMDQKSEQRKVDKNNDTQTQNQSSDIVPTTFLFIIGILVIALIAQMGVIIYYRRLWLKDKTNIKAQVLYECDSRQLIIK